jgi:hypothetical protein
VHARKTYERDALTGPFLLLKSMDEDCIARSSLMRRSDIASERLQMDAVDSLGVTAAARECGHTMDELSTGAYRHVSTLLQ